MEAKRTALIALATMLGLSACSYTEEKPPSQPAAEIVPVPSRTSANVNENPDAPPRIPVPTAQKVDAASLKKRIESGQKTTIVCTRSAESEPLIRGAIRVEEDTILDWAKNVPKDAYIAVYCTCTDDQSSTRTAHVLRENGYENAFVLEGGLKSWNAVAGPVTGGAKQAPKQAPKAK
jgi:rhodanese-related sulfurtransferase